MATNNKRDAAHYRSVELRAIRHRSGLSLSQFAGILGITKNGLALAERGARCPSETMLRLARAHEAQIGGTRAELQAYFARAAAERDGLVARGEWGALVAEAEAVAAANSWHLGTAIRALAAQRGITYRTAEQAMDEAFSQVAVAQD